MLPMDTDTPKGRTMESFINVKMGQLDMYCSTCGAITSCLWFRDQTEEEIEMKKKRLVDGWTWDAGVPVCDECSDKGETK